MATLADLREYVRVQTETTSAELPNQTVDSYLQEAFNRTIAAENRWPFYEASWSVTQTAGNAYITCPADLNKTAVVSLKKPSGHRLTLIDHETAEDAFSGLSVSGDPTHYSIWGELLSLWPSIEPAADQGYLLRGYRKPADWVAAGASAEPDCDDRLHLPLAHYAVALAYAQQEDEVLEVTYMTRWQRDVEAMRAQIMEPSRHSPVTMGGGKFRSMRPSQGWSIL